jgi:hypothetical protein
LLGLDERRDGGEESLDVLGGLLEPLDVSDVAAGLDREAEVVGRFLDPPADRVLGRQPIEGVIDLDGVELRRVVAQPLALRELFRVKGPAPVLVDPARAADPYAFQSSFSGTPKF